MRDYAIELEIYEGQGGKLRTDGTRPDFPMEGICAWMYGNYQVGQKFRYPEDLGELCPWLLDSLQECFAHSNMVGHCPGDTLEPHMRRH